MITAAGVRYIQVARRGPFEGDGVDVLSDTRSPTRLQIVGAWTLAHEMLDGGTLVQSAGPRRCSLLCTKQADMPEWLSKLLLQQWSDCVCGVCPVMRRCARAPPTGRGGRGVQRAGPG